MIEEVKENYIEEALKDLDAAIGARKPIKLGGLPKHLDDNNLSSSIKKIAHHMGLKVKINIKEVPATYTQKSEHQFTSSHLVKVKGGSSGSEGITAQVKIPPSLSLYGTPQFDNYPIDVYVSESCKNHPKAFYTIIAHELAHLLLHSIFHPKKDNEIYTDIAAMMLGSLDISYEGRKVSTREYSEYNTTTRTTTFGYLTDNNYHYAYKRIGKLISLREKKVKNTRKLLEKSNSKIQKIEKLKNLMISHLPRFDPNERKKINHKDTNTIIRIHSPSYLDNMNIEVEKARKELKIIKGAITKVKNWNAKTTEGLYTQSRELDLKTTSLYKSVRADIKKISKYLPFKDRLKIVAC